MASLVVKSPVVSMKQQWARRLIRQKLYHELIALHEKGLRERKPDPESFPLFGIGDRVPTSPFDLPPAPPPPDTRQSESFNLGIIGAGVAGLYIAMILNSLEIPDLTYEFMEASPRAGGRILTHHFTPSPHDYFDVGAMRFPNIPSQQRTFDLFKRTEICDILIPYKLSGVNTPQLFNQILYVSPDPPPDPAGFDVFQVSKRYGGVVPDAAVLAGPDSLLEQAFGPFIECMMEDFEKGFAKLLEYDSYSVREYLQREMKYDSQTINWLETMSSATGLFDQALSEGVFDSFSFETPGENDWYCIDGGTSVLVERMKGMIERFKPNRITYERQVTAIESHHNSIVAVFEDGQNGSSYTGQNGYTAIFNTASFGCTGQMDLRKAWLTSAQRDAIRQLNYDASAKVGIKFKYPWWITKCNITGGGSASTDLPLRTCVYPSYNLHDDPTQPAVLLCSYTWSQDASRISALIKDSSPLGEQQLKALLLHELWRLHEGSITEKDIVDAYLEHYSFDWYHDPYSVGAFALYGPSQFEDLYPYIVQPTSDGRLYFVGEAASTHHAWVVGALDSAYRAVYCFLYRFGQHDAIEKLEKEWGLNGEVECGENGTIHLQVALGTLKPEDRVRVPTNPAAFEKQLFRRAPKSGQRVGKAQGWRTW